MHPKLSVITICLNDKEGLEKTIPSVTGQSFHDYEYIVIDGNSTDGSTDIIKKYESKITFWLSEKDNGIYHAMNKGIDVAKGEYCLFLNSGDVLLKEDVLEKIFKNNYSEDILYGDMLYDCGDPDIRYCRQPEQLTFTHLFTNFLFHPSTFIKTDLFEKNGRYNEQLKIASDYEFFLKAIVFNNATYKYIPLTVSKHNNKGISSRTDNFEFVMKERSLIHKKYLPQMILDDVKNYGMIITSHEFKQFEKIKDFRYRKKIIYFLIDLILKGKIKKIKSFFIL